MCDTCAVTATRCNSTGNVGAYSESKARARCNKAQGITWGHVLFARKAVSIQRKREKTPGLGRISKLSLRNGWD